MKEIIIKIRISEKSERIMFLVEKNGEGTTRDILELVGALDLIKEAQLKKIGETNSVSS